MSNGAAGTTDEAGRRPSTQSLSSVHASRIECKSAEPTRASLVPRESNQLPAGLEGLSRKRICDVMPTAVDSDEGPELFLESVTVMTHIRRTKLVGHVISDRP